MDEKLLKAALRAVTDGRRDAEFDAALLAYVPRELRDVVRAALAVKPSITAGLLKEANAAAYYITHRPEFSSDDEAVKKVAKLFDMDERTVRKAAIDRARTPVNKILREMGIISLP